MAAPTAQEQAAARASHHPPTAPQVQHRSGASSRHELLASVNHGKPEIAATAKVNDFSGRAVVGARGAGAAGGAGVIHEASAPVHAGDSPRPTPPARSDSGTETQDRENQRQQTQLQARHERERQAPQQQRHAAEQQKLQEFQQRHTAPRQNPKEDSRENRNPPQP